MGVTLKVLKPLGGDYFLPAEAIHGTVELNSGCASSAAQVIVYLEGDMVSSNP